MCMNYPSIVSDLENTDIKLYEKVTEIFDLAMSQGELDVKTKVLIAMAVDAFSGASEGFRVLSVAAKNMGVTQAQIQEALRISYLAAGSKVLETIKNSQL